MIYFAIRRGRTTIMSTDGIITLEEIKGPFGKAFPSASPLASTEALPNP
jgi:hypothetical protein